MKNEACVSAKNKYNHRTEGCDCDLCCGIGAGVDAAIAISRNYTANDDTFPSEVTFANGRKVGIAFGGGKPHLTVGEFSQFRDAIKELDKTIEPGVVVSRNLSTSENREYWDAVDENAKKAAAYPAWKRGGSAAQAQARTVAAQDLGADVHGGRVIPRSSASGGAAQDAKPDSSNVFWLIEKGQPGGIYWFKGLRAYRGYGVTNHPFDSLNNWPDLFTESVHEAIQFRTREDAEAVWRLLPDNWKQTFSVVEHAWIPAVSTRDERDDDREAKPIPPGTKLTDLFPHGILADGKGNILTEPVNLSDREAAGEPTQDDLLEQAREFAIKQNILLTASAKIRCEEAHYRWMADFARERVAARGREIASDLRSIYDDTPAVKSWIRLKAYIERLSGGV